jgi:cytochrome c peroxidase
MGGEPTAERIVKALATFVRTIHAGDTAYDRMPAQGRDGSQAGKGFRVLSQVARCTLCHLPPTYSDGLFHNVGIGFDTEKPDLGRGKVLADAAGRSGEPLPPEAQTLQGAFKTPSLRGIALTGPYFHDGRAATLEEAVDLMARGGIENPHRDVKLKPVKLTAAERRLLLTFLRSLTPPKAPYKRPVLP